MCVYLYIYNDVLPKKCKIISAEALFLVHECTETVIIKSDMHWNN